MLANATQAQTIRANRRIEERRVQKTPRVSYAESSPAPPMPGTSIQVVTAQDHRHPDQVGHLTEHLAQDRSEHGTGPPGACAFKLQVHRHRRDAVPGAPALSGPAHTADLRLRVGVTPETRRIESSDPVGTQVPRIPAGQRSTTRGSRGHVAHCYDKTSPGSGRPRAVRDRRRRHGRRGVYRIRPSRQADRATQPASAPGPRRAPGDEPNTTACSRIPPTKPPDILADEPDGQTRRNRLPRLRLPCRPTGTTDGRLGPLGPVRVRPSGRQTGRGPRGTSPYRASLPP